MNKEEKEIQSNLFAAEFKNFCRKEFTDYTAQQEGMRKRYLFFSLLIIAAFILLVCARIPIKNIIVFDIIAFFAALYFISEIIKSYKTKAKNVILIKLLSFTGDFKPVQGSDELYANSLKILSSQEKYSAVKRIKGNYGLLNVEISEIIPAENSSNANLLIKIPYLKRFNGQTIIKRCGKNNFKEELKKVCLKDEDFDKYYEVYSTDEVEARMLINSRFIRRATQYAKFGIGENISLSFEQGNMNILVKTDKNRFDIPFFKPAGNIENYRIIILQIITIMKIVDSLKVEQNIGL